MQKHKLTLDPPPPCSFMTPLHVAAERAHNDIMEVLQKHGAKVNPPAVPLPGVQLKLLHACDMLLRCVCTLRAVRLQSLSCLWSQVNALDTLGQTALHRAALAGHLQTCRLLLGYGADASLVSLQGFTAAQMGNEAVQQILNGGCA